MEYLYQEKNSVLWWNECLYICVFVCVCVKKLKYLCLWNTNPKIKKLADSKPQIVLYRVNCSILLLRFTFDANNFQMVNCASRIWDILWHNLACASKTTIK